MGENKEDALRVNFDRKLKLEFHGVKVTSDTGLLAYREIDDVFELTDMVACELRDNGTGKNRQHSITALLRQSVYSRLAGYEDANDAEQSSVDPTMRDVVGERSKDETAGGVRAVFSKSLLTYQCKLLVLLVIVFNLINTVEAEEPYEVEWGQQIGTSASDPGYGIAVDEQGFVYAGGITYGRLGDSSEGNADVFLSKFDTTGSLVWVKQIGTSHWDCSWDLTLDKYGHIYICGLTDGSFGDQNAGGQDVFLYKCDTAGNMIWVRQVGSTNDDYVLSVNSDNNGNVYIGGRTLGKLGNERFGGYDAFVCKYDPTGNLSWTKQLGTSGNDHCRSVIPDSFGNIYISGDTSGSLGGPKTGGYDAFLIKMDETGNVVWQQQYGTVHDDRPWDLCLDSLGNAYITGYTLGSLGQASFGRQDVFVSKYDNSGNAIWNQQIGTDRLDVCYNIKVDKAGYIYISGQTSGLLGAQRLGGRDAFLSKLDLEGVPIWIQQLGSAGRDIARNMTMDDSNNVYITGDTDGSFFGQNAGSYDAFVAKCAFPESQPLHVSVDVKPGSCPNPLNVKSKGVLPVAILGTEQLDVNSIDAASVTLRGVQPIRSSFEDVATPASDTNDCNCTTEGPDGYIDLIMKFRTKDIADALGEIENNEEFTLTLEGMQINGTSLKGYDCAKAVGKHKRPRQSDVNQDGEINMQDISIVSSEWLRLDMSGYGDLNMDGMVNMQDFAVIASEWGESNVDVP
jgi:hypothetical protein